MDKPKCQLSGQNGNANTAQRVADGLHYADCSFNPEKAKTTTSKFFVRETHTEEIYVPPPFVKDKFIFARENI